MRTALLALVLTLSDADPPTGLALPATLRALLSTGQWDRGTPAGFRIVTLSNVAQGCGAQGESTPALRQQASHCIEQAYQRALELPPGRRPLSSIDGLWLAHLNLIFGAHDALGPCLDEPKHRQLAAILESRSLADPHAIAASYQSMPDRWPADQAVVLAGLAQADRAHHTERLTAPLARFEATLRPLLGDAGLPPSELAAHRATSRSPRGCANSFLTRYLADADPDFAHELWLRYRRDWRVTLGPVVGFREWPQGITGPADVDSGPIIAGIGTAASALGIAAARANGDEALALQLEASAAMALQLPEARRVQSLLADAIRFQARWQPVRAPQL